MTFTLNFGKGQPTIENKKGSGVSDKQMYKYNQLNTERLTVRLGLKIKIISNISLGPS